MRYMSNKESQIRKTSPGDLIKLPISTDLQENIDRLAILLSSCSDAVMREFSFGNPCHPSFHIIL